jgi:hypothetical protein
MRKIYLTLLVLSLALLLPSRSHAQAVIVGQPCGAGGLNAIATNGTPVVCTGSPLVWTSPSGGGGGINSGGALDNTVVPTQAAYGAKADVKFVYDAAFSNNSTTVTCPNSDCNFTSADVGKIVFGTTTSNIATALAGSVVVPQGTIQSINNANSIVVSVAANANCTTGSGTLCPLAWGTQDDATAINAAMVAAWETPNAPCRALQLPSSTMFIGSAVLQATIAQLSSACGGSQGTAAQSGIDTTQTGPEVYGQGPGNSILIPLPNFNFATCTGGSASTTCIGGTPNLEAHDFGINGLGQDSSGTPHTVIGFELQGSTGGGSCTGSTGFNLTFSNWLVRSTGSIGLQMGANSCGDPVYSNIVSEMFGATNCAVSGQLSTGLYGVACFGSLTTTLTITCSSTQTVNSYYGEYLDQNAAGPTVQQSGCIFNSFGDRISGTVSGATTFDQTGGVISQTNFMGSFLSLPSNTASTSNVILMLGPSGSNIHFRNTTLLGTGANNRLFSTNAGSLMFDEGGNTFTNGGTANSISGNAFGFTNSANGTACATGNFALTSGWGTSSVTSVAANGNVLGCHVTITGAAGAAGPVLTWTYPAAPIVAPSSCHIVGVSGTLTGVAVGTPGATTVAFTFAGTPSAQTYVFDVGCP